MFEFLVELLLEAFFDQFFALIGKVLTLLLDWFSR
jgi:hypothetical protein